MKSLVQTTIEPALQREIEKVTKENYTSEAATVRLALSLGIRILQAEIDERPARVQRAAQKSK